jgi:hypothetical protein
MSFPKIRHCIVCEEVREELNRKSTLLGFYGVTPEVEILLQDFRLPVGRLAFFLVGGPGQGSFDVSFKVSGDGGDVVPRTPNMRLVIEGAAKGYNLTFGLGPIRFPKPGRYRFTVFIDNQVCFEDTFGVSQAQPGDLK